MRSKSEVTIYDIAKALDVSPSTVSRALNGRLVSKRTSVKILEKARDLGYRQNIFASRLRSRRTHAIGSVVSHLNTAFVSNIVSGAEIMARRLGYSLVIKQSMNDQELYNNNLESLARNRVDGLLVASTMSHQLTSHQEKLRDLGVPIIIIEACSILQRGAEKSIGSNFNAAYHLTNQLAKKGCRRIAYISACSESAIRNELLQAYRQALCDNKLEKAEELIFPSHNFDQLLMDACRRLADADHRPDGIIFSNEVIASIAIPNLDAPAVNQPADLQHHAAERFSVRLMENNFNIDNYPILELGKVTTCLLTSLIEAEVVQSREADTA